MHISIQVHNYTKHLYASFSECETQTFDIKNAIQWIIIIINNNCNLQLLLSLFLFSVLYILLAYIWWNKDLIIWNHATGELYRYSVHNPLKPSIGYTFAEVYYKLATPTFKTLAFPILLWLLHTMGHCPNSFHGVGGVVGGPEAAVKLLYHYSNVWISIGPT